jgi:hypothetical protein
LFTVPWWCSTTPDNSRNFRFGEFRMRLAVAGRLMRRRRSGTQCAMRSRHWALRISRHAIDAAKDLGRDPDGTPRKRASNPQLG